MNPSVENPFTISFRKKPLEFISRLSQTDTIINTFSANRSPNQIFMITGVRGCGKTVTMAHIARHFDDEKNWIVIELSPERNLLKSLAAKLYHTRLQMHFIEAKIDLSFLGIGVSLKANSPVTDLEVGIEKTLTFLYRAPKMMLEPLNAGAIANSYANVFQLPMQKAKGLAALTMGYPSAFQVLGYLCWERDAAETPEMILPEYDQYLDEYVYRKIRSELSELDKSIVKNMVASGDTQVTQLRKSLHMSTEKFSVYRRRLINKGVIHSPAYGRIEFALPRFDRFVEMQVFE